MDNFVFCIANKKTATRLVKEMGDLVCATFFILIHVFVLKFIFYSSDQTIICYNNIIFFRIHILNTGLMKTIGCYNLDFGSIYCTSSAFKKISRFVTKKTLQKKLLMTILSKAHTNFLYNVLQMKQNQCKIN